MGWVLGWLDRVWLGGIRLSKVGKSWFEWYMVGWK